jgi:hypothetical protein
MSKIFIPANKPEDWVPLLAKREKDWKTGYSAKALAYCWQEADGFPAEVKDAFENSNIPLFKNAKLLMAFPEYKIPIPPYRSRPSQNDLFALAVGNDQLISIAIEGKVHESFGEPVNKWKLTDMGGKKERLCFLLDKLNLDEDLVGDIYYQLLHRTASAIIGAKQFNAHNALMLIHSFSQENVDNDKAFNSYCEFLKLFSKTGQIDSITFAHSIGDVDLYLGWVRGNEKYLKV